MAKVTHLSTDYADYTDKKDKRREQVAGAAQRDRERRCPALPTFHLSDA